MDEALLVTQLEELAARLCVTVRYEPIDDEEFVSRGGLCRLRNQHLIIIDNKACRTEQASVLAGALRQFDLSDFYLRPGVRAFLDGKSGEGARPIFREAHQAGSLLKTQSR